MEWVSWFEAPDYEFARQVLQRGTAALYFIAFLSTLNQFPALLGEHGLLPVPRYVDGHRKLRRPSLFRWAYSDTLLRSVCATGLLISLALVLGLPQLGPPWLPALAFLALWLLYMSVVNVGQTFYAFGWEMLLLEMGFTVAFLGSNQVPPPRTILILLVWLVFRLEFGAGMIKIHGGSEWRDLTALYYHHETQPMPGPLSRQAHLLPKPLHRVEVLGNHFAQLVVPFFLFFPQPLASVAAGIVVFTQLWLVGSGNFAWLNWSAIVLAFAAVNDPVIHAVLPFTPAPHAGAATTPPWWLAVVLCVTVLLLVLSYWPARNLVSRGQLMNASFNRWQLANTYGAFGTVTRHRVEIVVEGTRSDAPVDEAEWLEYGFKGKPGDVRRLPRQWAPYHLRLDWLMWFLPLRTVHEEWFYAFLGKLLDADKPTLRLLRLDPFDGGRPRWVRARSFLYRFATRAEFRETGQRWIRMELYEVIPPLSLPRSRQHGS
ncbi:MULTISPECIES: lipase maturation factor family protein [Arthrobacter]|uniref:Lipase maturation factor family protein n=1 Tax=Arthrobacter terricola TaxID=2547396 RepID=A0A4R5KYF5_9MICC|nr:MULTISPECIES: lipase maturation factor family protein [Arthrobacter]MBT8160137.1 lipase maturation factor family protein [Arthrobacter sp. GN70]TDG01132.1 lipase maturation factor family protein [Arthrobacter terricola]